ncbi:hypothetical protein DB346_02660 [Verrucomicrobia bacterium LW23]|nr:hypothetical protein DB346_03995 [Verrucomicrobia bacterium LW23]PTY04350.1 hypothetical protein DB346_02660 [Verrucomicrobia bacterium LW23]
MHPSPTSAAAPEGTELLGHFDLAAEERTRCGLQLTLDPPPTAAIDRGFCDIISHFLAQYAGRLLAGLLEGAGAASTSAEVRQFVDDVSYLANELLENAVKYRCGGPVHLGFCVDAHEFVLVIRNEMQTPRASELRRRAAEILERDPADLLIEQAERNAEDPESSGSGIGFLTLLAHYGARLGWRLQPIANPVCVAETTCGQGAGTGATPLELSTMATLALPYEAAGREAPTG